MKMANSENLTPQLRFVGFTDAWVQRKLGEVAEIIGGGTPDTSNPEFWGGEIDWYSPTEIGKNIYAFSSQKKITGLGLKKSSAKILPADKTILFTSRASIGDMAILKKSAATNQGFQSLVVNEDNDVYFLYSMGNVIKEYAIKNSSGSTFLEISGKNLAKMNLQFPSISEQAAIGNFFRILDNIIAKCKRKLDGLKKLKSGYLQQMFPQTGDCVPRIRFSGFTEPWEEKKLGEVVERVTRKNKELESTLPLTISAQYGLVAQKEFFDKEVASKDLSNYYLLKNGDFAYNKSYSNGYPWGAVKRLDKYDMGVLSTLYIVFNPINVDSDFLVQYYETTHWYNEVAQYAAEGARNHGLLNIPTSDFFETILTIPTDSAEQIAIGNFFRNLDNQITAQQNKLDKLTQLKAAYLQKMFV